MIRLSAVVFLVVLTGCAAKRQHFIPREDVRAQSPRGWPAAQYPVTIAGKEAGEVKVWSEGTMRAELGGDERTILHVGFEVENRTDGELDFDVKRCEVVDVLGEDGRFADLSPHDESGTLHVAAGQVGLIDLEFLLPRGTRPRDLDSFRVQWAVATASGEFSQSTPFRVDNTYYRPRYHYYHYSPWSPWWGFGAGYAVGRHHSFWWGPRWGFYCW